MRLSALYEHDIGVLVHNQFEAGHCSPKRLYMDLRTPTFVCMGMYHPRSSSFMLALKLSTLEPVPGALGQRMEKVLKAHVDAMWARLAEENARRELQERERVQQVTMLLTNFVSKDMPGALERGFKKEFAAIGPVVAQAVLPPLHKAVSTTVAESFQVAINDVRYWIVFF